MAAGLAECAYGRWLAPLLENMQKICAQECAQTCLSKTKRLPAWLRTVGVTERPLLDSNQQGAFSYCKSFRAHKAHQLTTITVAEGAMPGQTLQHLQEALQARIQSAEQNHCPLLSPDRFCVAFRG